MCGIAGYAGIPGWERRSKLTMGLALGIDLRGGDAAGFLALDGKTSPVISRRTGTWLGASDAFYDRATGGRRTLLMHARFATCGKKTKSEAHPFEVRRNGQPVLWGVHNGVIYNAAQSATRHRRRYDVDSRELFELLADGQNEKISRLEGYGTIMWVEAKRPDRILACRMTESADLTLARTFGGGMVWGSTARIVHEAIGWTDLRAADWIDFKSVGTVYSIDAKGVHLTNRRKVLLQEQAFGWGKSMYGYDDNDPGLDEKEFMRPDGTLPDWWLEYKQSMARDWE